MPACRAAPRATTSLTANDWSGGLPLSSWSICRVIGMCVEPPTSRTRSTCSQLESGLADQLLHREPGADQQVARQRLELRPAQRHGQHLAAVGAGDGRLRELAEGALGALGGGLQSRERLRIGTRVGPHLLA